MASWRLRLLLTFFLIFSLVIISRLFYWQILCRDRLSIQAESLHTSVNQIEAPRGKIFAADGLPLATSQETYLVYASLPDIQEEVEKIASRLTTILFPGSGQEEKLEFEEGMK